MDLPVCSLSLCCKHCVQEVAQLVARLTPNDLDAVRQLLNNMTIAPQQPATPTPGPIYILKLFQSETGDVSDTARQVLEGDLLAISKVKLSKKDVGVLRNMVEIVGLDYVNNVDFKMIDVARKMQKVKDEVKDDLIKLGINGVDMMFLVDEIIANLKTEIEKRFYVNELIRYKKRLSYNAKKSADAKKLASAA
jgi:hypothetical protein